MREDVRNTSEAPHWSQRTLRGRLVELSGRGPMASLTCAVGLVLEAQRDGEPAAWITLPHSSFYPPDVARSGVDLRALLVVRVPSPAHAARAAERLVRSGFFGVVVLDLVAPMGAARREVRVPMAAQGRLVGLAQKHDCAIVCITDTPDDAPSLGSMVSLRAEVVRERVGEARFRCTVTVIKDKQRGPGWTHAEVARGPDGLR